MALERPVFGLSLIAYIHKLLYSPRGLLLTCVLK